MTYSKKGNFYIVTRHDSLLAVAFIRGGKVASPAFKTLPPVYNFGNKLDPAKILAAVQEGIAAANAIFGTDFQRISRRAKSIMSRMMHDQKAFTKKWSSI